MVDWIASGCWAALAVAAVLALRIAYRQPPKVSPHVLGLTALMLAALWSLDMGPAQAGSRLHLLGTPVATLLLDWPLAVVAVGLASMLKLMATPAGWAGIGIDAWLSGMLAIGWIVVWRRLLERLTGPHLFVFLLGIGFFGCGLSLPFQGAVVLALVDALQPVAPDAVAAFPGHAVPWLVRIPMAYAEAFLSGGLVTIAVVLKPQWIATFDDAVYLKRRSP